MGSMNVYDDGSQSWGGIGNSIAGAITGAPAKAAAFTHTIETIKDMRIKRARDEEAYAAAKALADSVDSAVPQAYVAPRAYTAADISNPAVLDAPLSVTDRVSGSFGGADVPNGMFTDPRALALAEARRKSGILGEKATLMKDPSQWAAQSAYAENAATGMPASAADRYRLQFGATGRYPTTEESKTPNAQNFAIVNEDGTGTGQGFASLNAGKTAIDGTPIVLKPGQRLMETGPATLQAPNPLKDEASARERLAVLSREIGSNGPTPEQQIQIQQLADVAYKPTRVVEKVGDRETVRYVQQNPIPPWVTALMGATAPAPVASAAPAAPASPAAVATTTTPPVPAAPAAPVATVPPVVNPNADRVVETRPGSSIELRKEVMQQPSIKTYGEAVPMYNVMVKAAQGDVENGLLPDSSADLNIIYAVAKLFDPGSVVREGELKLAQGTAPIADMLQAAWTKAITGEGLMTPEMRANLIHQGMIRMEQYRVSKNLTHNQYTDIATKTGIDPAMVIPQMPDMLPYNREAITNPSITPQAPQAPIIERGNNAFGVGGGR